MAGMARRLPLSSLPLALVVAATAVGAGCTGDGAAALTTTAIVRLPTGFHAARAADDAMFIRVAAARRSPTAELVTFRLEAAHRRAAFSADARPATGGFVCQIDMGTTPSD